MSESRERLNQDEKLELQRIIMQIALNYTAINMPMLIGMVKSEYQSSLQSRIKEIPQKPDAEIPEDTVFEEILKQMYTVEGTTVRIKQRKHIGFGGD